MKSARILALLILMLLAIVAPAQAGKTTFASGWAAFRPPSIANCQSVYIAGTTQSGTLTVEVWDAVQHTIMYADVVPGNYFTPSRMLDVGSCAYSINVFVFPTATPHQNYLVFALSLTIPSVPIRQGF